MYIRPLLFGFVLSLVLLALPAAAVKPLCTDFQDGEGASFNSMMYDPQFGWDGGPTDYNPFTAGLGVHCANDWHYADVDGDGTVEVYLLTGETFTTWFNAEINGVDTFKGPIPVHNFDIIAMDRSWNNGASYGCVDNPENPTVQSREFCNKENLSAFVEKAYGSPQRELKTPPIFGFTGDVIIDSFKGVKQWFAYGWTDLTPRYKDMETGVEKPYMVLNCGTDEDCNTGRCIKPTSDPVDNFCENDPFSRGLGYENFYLPDKEPSKGTDNVLPAGGKEVCRFVRPIANGSRIEEAELREIIVTGFDRDSERNKTIEARVYSNNNGKPGSLLGKVDKDIIDAGIGSIREEILKLPEPVIMGEGALWVCLKYPYSLSEGYLSYFNEGGFDMFVYIPERNDVNRFETERGYIKVKISGVIDKKEYGDIIREFALPAEDFVYDSTTDNTLFKGKDICKPMETSEKAYITEIRGAGFDKGDYIGRKQPLKAVVREDSNGSPGGVLGEAYGEFSVTGTVHEEAVKFENPVGVGGKFWACLNTPDSGTNFIAFNYHGTEAGRDVIYNSMDGTTSVAYGSRSYAIQAKAAVYSIAAQPSAYPFSQASGGGGESSGEGGEVDVALAISAISLLGVTGAALAFGPKMRGLGTKLSGLKARIRPVFPTEKDSITPYVDNNAVRRRIAGRYLSGFGNAAAADKIANWLPGGHYWKAKKQYGEQYALELEKQNEERLIRERMLLLKDYIIGSTAPNVSPDISNILEDNKESLGNKLVKEFKSMGSGSFKSILFNGQIYYLEKTAQGEEIFTGMGKVLEGFDSNKLVEFFRQIKNSDSMPLSGGGDALKILSERLRGPISKIKDIVSRITDALGYVYVPNLGLVKKDTLINVFGADSIENPNTPTSVIKPVEIDKVEEYNPLDILRRGIESSILKPPGWGAGTKSFVNGGGGLLDGFVNGMKGFGEWALDGLQQVGGAIKGAAEWVWNGITTVGGYAVDFVKGVGKSLYNTAKFFLWDIPTGIWDWATTSKDHLGDIGNGIKYVADGVGWTVTHPAEAMDKAGKIAGKVWEYCSGSAENFGECVGDVGQLIIGGGSLSKGAEKIVNAGTKAGKTIADATGNMGNKGFFFGKKTADASMKSVYDPKWLVDKKLLDIIEKNKLGDYDKLVKDYIIVDEKLVKEGKKTVDVSGWSKASNLEKKEIIRDLVEKNSLGNWKDIYWSGKGRKMGVQHILDRSATPSKFSINMGSDLTAAQIKRILPIVEREYKKYNIQLKGVKNGAPELSWASSDFDTIYLHRSRNIAKTIRRSTIEHELSHISFTQHRFKSVEQFENFIERYNKRTWLGELEADALMRLKVDKQKFTKRVSALIEDAEKKRQLLNIKLAAGKQLGDEYFRGVEEIISAELLAEKTGNKILIGRAREVVNSALGRSIINEAQYEKTRFLLNEWIKNTIDKGRLGTEIEIRTFLEDTLLRGRTTLL